MRRVRSSNTPQYKMVGVVGTAPTYGTNQVRSVYKTDDVLYITRRYLLNELNSGGLFGSIFDPSVGVYQRFVSNGSILSQSSTVVVPFAFFISGETNLYFRPLASTTVTSVICGCGSSLGLHPTRTPITAINHNFLIQIGAIGG